MLVGRKASWYRPYYLMASGREYKVDRIHFYQNNEVLVSTRESWLGSENNGDIESIELPIDEIKVKRKERFDGKPFVISKGKESYGDDLLCDLYIPSEMFNIHFVENVIKYKTQVRAVYKGSNDIYIDVYIKSIDDELISIRTQYEEVYKNCDGYKLGFYTEDILENLDKLKTLAEKYVEEKKRINSLTINDIDV